MTVSLVGSATVGTPVIPTRFIRLGTQEQPRNHCGLQQVLDELLGVNLDIFRGPDGTLDAFNRILSERLIPEASAYIVQKLDTPYDWCRTIQFEDGPGGPRLVLRYRNIAWVNVCFLRVLPSQPWYRFVRFRNVDGTEFQRVGFTEPPQDAPMSVPPNVYFQPSQVQTLSYTGIEDVDMMVDTVRRMLIIPPRVLIAGAFFPIWNYTFFPGTMNVEVHYTFGFAPTRYESGEPLVFDSQTGVVIPYDSGYDGVAQNPNLPMAQINWASGMPVGLTNAVARLVVNRILRRKWRAQSNGLSSIGVDGGSESYGTPYAGDLDNEDQRIISDITAKYGTAMVI